MESRVGVNYEGAAGGHYARLQDIDDIGTAGSDDSRLNQLGYKQELGRKLSALANFSVTFSIISILTGITTLFGNGLAYGGPVTMVYGWPIVGLLTLFVGLSMAEICSAYPTSGGLYFWSAKLCGDDWGPFASWLTGCNVGSLYETRAWSATSGKWDVMLVGNRVKGLSMTYSQFYIDQFNWNGCIF